MERSGGGRWHAMGRGCSGGGTPLLCGSQRDRWCASPRGRLGLLLPPSASGHRLRDYNSLALELRGSRTTRSEVHFVFPPGSNFVAFYPSTFSY